MPAISRWSSRDSDDTTGKCAGDPTTLEGSKRLDCCEPSGFGGDVHAIVVRGCRCIDPRLMAANPCRGFSWDSPSRVAPRFSCKQFNIAQIGKGDQARSKRSRFITLFQAATKSWTNFFWASELP